MRRVQNRSLRQILDDDINRKLGVEKENSCFVIPSLKITAEPHLGPQLISGKYLAPILSIRGFCPATCKVLGPTSPWSVYEEMQ